MASNIHENREITKIPAFGHLNTRLTHSRKSRNIFLRFLAYIATRSRTFALPRNGIEIKPHSKLSDLYPNKLVLSVVCPRANRKGWGHFYINT